MLCFQGDRRPADSQSMATIILQILAQREKLHKDIFTQLRYVLLERYICSIVDYKGYEIPRNSRY